MAQISDRSPHQGCKQRERVSTEAVSTTRGVFVINTSTLQRCTWTLNGPGGKMAVAWAATCPIAAEMAHWWNGGHLGGVMLQWDEWGGPLLTTTRGRALSYQPVQELFLYITITELSVEHVTGSIIHAFTKVGKIVQQSMSGLMGQFNRKSKIHIFPLTCGAIY